MKFSVVKLSRIKKSTEIRQILHSGTRIRLNQISIVFKPGIVNRDRFAVLVGKQHGISVVRNRIKRIVREVIRLNPANSLGQYFDVIIRPFYGIKPDFQKIDLDFKQWRNSLKG